MTCQAQLMSDWTDSSIITINGIDFAPVGFDGSSGFGLHDLDSGLQKRIWDTVQEMVTTLGGEVVDCRPKEDDLL